MKNAYASNLPRAAGEQHWHAHYTDETVRQIRADHVDAHLTATELAARYGGSVSAIRRILTGVTWKTVTGGTDVLRRQRPPLRPNRRLTMAQADMLRKLHPVCRVSQSEWGQLLGLTQNAINDILKRRTYKPDGE